MRKADIESALDLSTWSNDDPSSNLIQQAYQSRDRDRDREKERDRERGIVHGEARELMLEVLSHFARGRWSMVDLWVNYDCNVEGEDLFERLVKFLSRVSNGGSNVCDVVLTLDCRECFLLEEDRHMYLTTLNSLAWTHYSNSLLIWLQD